MRHAIFLHEFSVATESLRAVKQRLTIWDQADPILEALQYDLLFNEHFLDWHPKVNGWSQEAYRKALPEFSQPASTELGDIIRRRHLLTIKLHAELDGFDTLDRADISLLIADTPFSLSCRLWYDAATWAFQNQDTELLALAFNEFLLNPANNMAQTHWQRVNLMYQLLKGKASRRDVEETIKTLHLRPQLQEFCTRLLPACEAAGLVDDSIRRKLDERTVVVEQRKTMPTPERRTKSFIRGQ